MSNLAFNPNKGHLGFNILCDLCGKKSSEQILSKKRPAMPRSNPVKSCKSCQNKKKKHPPKLCPQAHPIWTRKSTGHLCSLGIAGDMEARQIHDIRIHLAACRAERG